MTVHAGEIVGVSGLVGAGRTETMRAVFGIDSYRAGEVLVDGKKVPRNSPEKAGRMGMCLLPEDRKVEGLAAAAEYPRKQRDFVFEASQSGGIVKRARKRQRSRST